MFLESPRQTLSFVMAVSFLALVNPSPASAQDRTAEPAGGYLGSQEYREYKESVRRMSDALLFHELIKQVGGAELSCGTSGALVALSAALDSLPVLGLMPDIATGTPIFGEHGSGFGAVAGGIAGGVADVPIMAIEGLSMAIDDALGEGTDYEDYDRPFNNLRGAYLSTYNAANALFSSNSACMRRLDNVGAVLLVKNEREQWRQSHRRASEGDSVAYERTSDAGGSAIAAETGHSTRAAR